MTINILPSNKAFYNHRPGSKNKMADNPGDHVASYAFKVHTGTYIRRYKYFVESTKNVVNSLISYNEKI